MEFPFTHSNNYPCSDCGLLTVPRDEKGQPLAGRCEYFRVPNALWESVVDEKTIYLCVTCLEKRLKRELVWTDFLIKGSEVSDHKKVREKFIWWDSSRFDNPLLAKRKWPGPKRGQLRRNSIIIVKAEPEDFN